MTTPHAVTAETAVNGTSISWSEMGKGEPVVLLHGLLDSHRTWRRTAPILARHFRVLMPDAPGFGRSGRPDAPYTLEWYAETFAAWMRKIGVPRAHICGHSFGGGIAQWMILEQRECVDRLALVSAGGLGPEVSMALRLAAFPLFGRLLSPYVLRYGVPLVARNMSQAMGHMEPEEADIYVEMIRIPGTQRAFQRTLESVINVFGQHQQTYHHAHKVEKLPPIAVFWGKKDPILPVHHGHLAMGHYEGVTLTTYERCGHFPHLEFPSTFSAHLLDFLHDPQRPPATLIEAPESE